MSCLNIRLFLHFQQTLGRNCNDILLRFYYVFYTYDIYYDILLRIIIIKQITFVHFSVLFYLNLSYLYYKIPSKMKIEFKIAFADWIRWKRRKKENRT